MLVQEGGLGSSFGGGAAKSDFFSANLFLFLFFGQWVQGCKFLWGGFGLNQIAAGRICQPQKPKTKKRGGFPGQSVEIVCPSTNFFGPLFFTPKPFPKTQAGE